jgi:hypothetical protein
MSQCGGEEYGQQEGGASPSGQLLSAVTIHQVGSAEL